MSSTNERAGLVLRDQILRQALVIASPDLSGRGNLEAIEARDCFPAAPTCVGRRRGMGRFAPKGQAPSQ
jgi:hypothetical protein